MDPLESINELSDVNAAAVLTQEGKRIVLLGDIHTPYKGKTCKKCTGGCFTVKRLLRALKKFHEKTETDLDTFAEFHAPSIDRKNPAAMQKWVAEVQAGQPLILSEMRQEYFADAYQHDRKPGARFHYVDVRSTPAFQKKGIMPFLWLYAHKHPEDSDPCARNYFSMFQLMYPKKEKLNAAIADLCWGASDPSNIVSKQYHKLTPADRRKVKSFFSKYMMNIQSSFSYQKQPEEYFVQITALPVEFYAICRFLRFFHRQPAGSTSVFLAGVAHTAVIDAFLRLWGATVVFDNHPAKDPYANKLVEQVLRYVKKDRKCFRLTRKKSV
jgi:hypothetical protein